jgi:hypothetical protein
MAWSSLVHRCLPSPLPNRTHLSHYLGDIETNVSDLHTCTAV